MSNEAKCSCQFCNGHIAFDAAMAGQVAACPHCGMETKLFIPNVAKASPSKPPQNVSVEIKRGVSPLGVASLVLGIIACVFCWIPLLGLLVIPLALIGVLLAVVGIIMAGINIKTGFAFPISGVITCLLSIILAIAISGGTAALIQKAKKESDAASEKSESDQTKANKISTKFQHQIKLGNVMVTVMRVDHYSTSAESPTQHGLVVQTSNYLLINLLANNESADRIYDYSTWRNAAKLTDNKGNIFPRIIDWKKVVPTHEMRSGWTGDPPDDWTKAQFGQSTRLQPHGGQLEEMLGFDIPASHGEILYLELPAENIGGSGVFRFEIPTNIIVPPI